MAQQKIKQIKGTTQGSILFLGTNSVVSEEFNDLNWNQSSKILTVGGDISANNGNFGSVSVTQDLIVFGNISGGNNSTSQNLSFAVGELSQANGQASAALGIGSIANGTYSFAAGIETRASKEGQFSIGQYNTENNNQDIFVIGNGADGSNRSDLAKFATNSIIFNAGLKVDYLDLSTQSVTGQERRIYWDNTNKTVAIGLAGGNVNLQVGQEEYYLVFNNTGATLSNGKLVGAVGVSASGDVLNAGYYLANGTFGGEFVLGVVTEDIPNGEKGFVTEFGVVRGIDATGTEYGETWMEGDTLYASATIPGGLTKVKPVAPNIAVLSAIVISATSSGSIFVRPTFNGTLEDLDNVDFFGVTPSEGDIIRYSATQSVWKLEEYNEGAFSAGIITGATSWSQTGTGQILLPTVRVALYDNPNFLGNLKLYDVLGATTGTGGIPSLTDDDTNYIFIDYNSGNPIWDVSNTDANIDGSDTVRFMTVYRLGNFVHTLEFGNIGAGLVEKLNARQIAVERFARESGLTIGLSGSSGIVTISEGVAWNGPFRQTLAAVNSIDDFMFKNWRVSGNWTYSVSTPFTFSALTDLINNTYFDNGDLITASAGSYLTNYYYRGQEVNDHIYEIYSQDQYDTFAEAELAGVPTIPELVSSHAVLVGRVIVQVGTYSASAQSSFTETFASSTVASHNDLTGLQGGGSGEFYHLTSAEYANNAYKNIDNDFTVNQTVNGYELKTETWTESNILIAGTNSVVGSGFTFNDSATTSNNLWSAQKTFDYSNRSTIDGNKTFSGDVQILGTLSVVDSFTAGTEFTVNTLANFNGNVSPTINNQYDLGTPSNQWRQLYLSDSLYVNGATISSQNDSILLNSINFGTAGNPTILSGRNGFLTINGVTFSVNSANIITVAKSGGQFTSVKTAVESITGASSSNPIVVKVSAGEFTEDPFTLKSHVAIIGEGSVSTILKSSNSAVNFLTAVDNAFIADLQITGATGTSASGIYYSSTTSVASQAIVNVENVRFGANWNHVTVRPTSGGNIALQMTNIKYGAQPFTLGFYITSDGSSTGRMQLRNVTTTAGGIQSTTGLIFAKTDQPNCTIIANSVAATKVGSGPAQGIGFWAENGGLLRVNVANFQRFDTVLYVPNTGSGPTIDAIGFNFENCTKDVEILNNATTGKIDGISDYTKTIIPKEAPLYIVGRDQRRITVAQKGGDFTSIKSAVDSITDSSESSRYVIEVGPGVFYEQEIDLSTKPYVSIVGSNIQTTQVYATSSSQNLFKMGLANEISFLSLNGVGPGFSAILADDSGDFSQVHKLSFYDCDTGIKVLSSTQDTLFYGEYVDFNGTFSQAVCVDAQGSSFSSFANIENAYFFPGVTGSMGICVYDTNAQANITVATLEGVGNDIAFYVENGGKLIVSSTDVTGYETGLSVPNIGTASNFVFNAVVFDETVTVPLKIKQPNTIGFFQGSLYDHTTIDNDSQDVYWNFLDQFDGELNITRKSSVTFADGTTTDLTTLVFETAPMGVISGGEISIVSGLTVSISSGYGYLEMTIGEVHKRIDWSTQDFLATDNASEYIYINENDVLTSSGSLPSISSNIVLGRVVTKGGAILFIDNTRVDTKHAANKLNLFNRKAIGSIYESGSIVSSATAFGLNVSAGSYWFGESNFTPTGGATISFEQFYRDGLGDWIISVTDSVTSQYDAGSGSLITMSSSYYTKHTLYVVGDSADEKYLMVVGQNQYLNLVDAEDAPLPTPPSYFEDGVASLASIYVQEGLSSILQIEDIRPVLGFKASGVNATSDHGNLLGLSDDDHPQYLLVDGSRAMAGNLQMGSNSITGVNQVNGVIVEDHSDRHLPNGADPLATGAPSTIGSTNQEGTANAFARQDHIHAHGDQLGGTLHATASSVSAGFMSAADKVIFDAIPATYVNVTGDTMTGTLTMSNNKITQVATGSTNSDATNYGQVVKIGGFDNFIYVSEKEDFGASVSGVYTLVDNKTYFVTTTVDLGGGRLVSGQNTTILGGSSENCRIKSTGLTSGVPLITSSYSIPMRGLTLEAATVFNLDAITPSTNQAIDWFGVNVASPNIGTISNYSNFIASDCAFLASGGLVFDGSMGTIGFSQTLFTNFSNTTTVTLAPTLTVTRRFRIIYSSFVVTGTGVALDVATATVIPNESYILDNINFSGGGTYLNGITATNSNESLFVSCVGIQNTTTNGYMYFSNNTTDTTIGVANVNVFVKAAGTSTALNTNSKFDHTDNRLTYTGAFTQLFHVTVNANVRAASNNQVISIGIAKNGDTTFADISEVTIRTATSNQTYPGSTQLVVEMSSTDFVELYVKNTSTVNVRVEDMNFFVTKVGN